MGWADMVRRRIELVSGRPCACVAKTDRERDGDDWRIVCRLCGDVWSRARSAHAAARRARL